MADPEITGEGRSTEASDTFEAHGVIVDRARAAGIGDDLTRNDLFLALKAVHDANPVQRSRVLEDGPLWASYAGRGIEVGNALLQILSFFGVIPRH